jgi:hypothetical protein
LLEAVVVVKHQQPILALPNTVLVAAEALVDG